MDNKNTETTQPKQTKPQIKPLDLSKVVVQKTKKNNKVANTNRKSNK